MSLYRIFILAICSVLFFQQTVYSKTVQRSMICSPNDPDFEGYDYEEEIPRCKRNVSDRMKREIASRHGIPVEEYKEYHYDHIISLCAGGSNHPMNLQPRRPKNKLEKDKVEWDVCRQMRKGEMRQSEAIKILGNLEARSVED